MKEGIHPKYETATVTCVCGNTFVTRSTKAVIKLDLCSNCHPFFTGKQKLVDTAGRVERFAKKFASTEGKMVARKAKPKAKAAEKKTKSKILTTSPKRARLAAKKAEKAEKLEKKEK